MSAGFGKWNAESQSNQASLNFSGIFTSEDSLSDDNDSTSNSNMMTLPLFNNSIGLPAEINFASIKSSLEAQMPQQVLGMSYQQRFKVFVSFLILSAVFFALAFFVGLPMITIRPQKFAISFTCGSLTFMGSFALLRGPAAHCNGMISKERLPFTVLYLGSMLGTMYCTFTAGGAKGYMSVLFMSAVQLLALLWYLVTFLPGGAQGMKVLTAAIVTVLKPVITGCSKCCASLAMKVLGRAI
jgi:hypothetical protein